MFVQAKNYTPTSGRQIDLIVVHDMEAGERSNTAENVAMWFAGQNAPRASAHWCFDNNSSVRCVLDKDVAWHAPGASHNGLGYEHAGFAKQTRAEWRDPYGVAMLKISAAQAAIDCRKYGLPVKYVGVAGLLAGHRGITTHWDVTKAFKRSTHWDPGTGFPMDWYLDLVRSQAGVIVPRPPGTAVPDGVLKVGSSGETVRQWQTVLIGAKLLPADGADGKFGPQTEAATIAFQKMLGVEADGMVGPKTREATARLFAWLAAKRPVPKAPPFPGLIRQGATGGNVRIVQDRLNTKGHSIKVDGVFGPATDNAVRVFQSNLRLAIDGVVGPRTWNALWS